MDSDILIEYLNKFDELRFSRISVAQQFVANYTSNEELFADIANILALMFAANQIAKTPKGFQSDSE